MKLDLDWGTGVVSVDVSDMSVTSINNFVSAVNDKCIVEDNYLSFHNGLLGKFLYTVGAGHSANITFNKQ